MKQETARDGKQQLLIGITTQTTTAYQEILLSSGWTVLLYISVKHLFKIKSPEPLILLSVPFAVSCL